MYQEELMLEYVRPRSKKPIAYLMILAAVIFLVLGLCKDYRRKYCIAPFDPQNITTGAPVYTDVIAISGPLYGHTTSSGLCYFIAVDANGNSFNLRITNEMYAEMVPQQEYFRQLHTDAPPPEPYRVRGAVQHTSQADRHPLHRSPALPEEYREMDFTYTLQMETDIFVYFFAVIFGFSGIMFLLIFGYEEDRGNESVQRLEALGLTQEAAAQFHKKSEYLYQDDAIIFTRDFIFSKAYRSIVPYGDIVWCSCVYQEVRSKGHVYLRGYYLEYVTLFGPPLQLTKLINKEHVEEMIGIILSRKPDVLVGKDLENKIRYEALKNKKP